MSVLSTLRNHQLASKHGRCWFNSAFNKYTYRNVYGMNLRWVVGATKYHTKEETLVGNGFMEDKKTLRTVEDLKTNWDDTHSWLEDEEGYVYDCITERDYERLRPYDPYGLKWKLKAGFIQGETYHSLRAKGYELIPFPEESIRVVKEKLIERNENKENNDLAGLIKSVDYDFVVMEE